MKRRAAITLLGGMTAWPFATSAQGNRRYRIGLLETLPADRNAANLDALRRGPRELGYIQGPKLESEYRSAAGRGDRFPQTPSEVRRARRPAPRPRRAAAA